MRSLCMPRPMITHNINKHQTQGKAEVGTHDVCLIPNGTNRSRSDHYDQEREEPIRHLKTYTINKKRSKQEERGAPTVDKAAAFDRI